MKKYTPIITVILATLLLFGGLIAMNLITYKECMKKFNSIYCAIK